MELSCWGSQQQEATLSPGSPDTKASNKELWVFLNLALNKHFSAQKGTGTLSDFQLCHRQLYLRRVGRALLRKVLRARDAKSMFMNTAHQPWPGPILKPTSERKARQCHLNRQGGSQFEWNHATQSPELLPWSVTPPTVPSHSTTSKSQGPRPHHTQQLLPLGKQLASAASQVTPDTRTKALFT